MLHINILANKKAKSLVNLHLCGPQARKLKMHSTQQPETETYQDLFIPGVLINILWKTRCIQYLIRSTAT